MLSHLTNHGALDSGSVRVRNMVIPDIWIEAGTQKEQYDIAELNQPHIVAKVEKILGEIKANDSSKNFAHDTQQISASAPSTGRADTILPYQ